MLMPGPAAASSAAMRSRFRVRVASSISCAATAVTPVISAAIASAIRMLCFIAESYTSCMQRRDFLTAAVAAPAAAGLLHLNTKPARAQAGPLPAKPARLKAGDTVGLVAPANATFNSIDLD